MKAALLSIICFGLISPAFAQSRGYFGKRTIIEIGANGSAPLFQNIFYEKGYAQKDGRLQKAFFTKDYGFRAALGTCVDESMAVLFEYDYRNYQINALKEGELNRQYASASGVMTDYIRPKVAFLDMEEHVFMLKYLLKSDEGIVPAGFVQEFGIGYSLVNVKDRNVEVEYDGQGSYAADSVSANLIDPDFDELRGLTFTYGAKMNFPLTRSILFGIGVRYSYNALLSKSKFRKEELSEAWLSEREMWSRTNQRRQLGIVSLGMGFTFCF
jgi:hypothetical protein